VRRRFGAVAVLVVLAAGACSTPATGQQRLNSAMVGSETVLPREDARAVSEVGLELVALAAPLEIWWRGLDAPDVDAAVWLAAAPELLAQMSEGVERIERRLDAARHRGVTETFRPYVVRWKRLIAALEDLRLAVADGDETAGDAAIARYNAERAAIRRLDEQRVARVVAAFGRDEAERLLRSEGADPERFGLR
jgi:hypothetical protein